MYVCMYVYLYIYLCMYMYTYMYTHTKYTRVYARMHIRIVIHPVVYDPILVAFLLPSLGSGVSAAIAHRNSSLFRCSCHYLHPVSCSRFILGALTGLLRASSLRGLCTSRLEPLPNYIICAPLGQGGNLLWSVLAPKLVETENHRTEAEAEVRGRERGSLESTLSHAC